MIAMRFAAQHRLGCGGGELVEEAAVASRCETWFKAVRAAATCLEELDAAMFQEEAYSGLVVP